jgi:hypothetical protein
MDQVVGETGAAGSMPLEAGFNLGWMDFVGLEQVERKDGWPRVLYSALAGPSAHVVSTCSPGAREER